VLDEGVRVTTSDWGTSVTDPADYFARVSAAGVFTADGGALAPVPAKEIDDISATVKDAQRALYRRIAAMSRREKLNAGAYVYFTFLRPFAETAGVDDRLDWTVPRDSLDVYEGLATLERMPDAETDESVPYYTPIYATSEAAS
jgi:hypothetical protein